MKAGALIAIALTLLACSRKPEGQGQPAPSGTDGLSYAVDARWDPDSQTGLFQMQLHAARPSEVFYEIKDRNGRVLADAAYRADSVVRTYPEHLQDIRPWTAETPELYTLHLLVNGHESVFPVGFRSILPTQSRDTFLVNGKKVPFKGADFHAAGRSQALEELVRLKRLNVNALNSAPLTPELAALADSIGFYVYPQRDTLGKPDPESRALKQQRQELSIRAENLQEGLFTVTNHRRFTSLADYQVRWRVERDGKPVGLFPRRALHFDTPPQAEETFRISLPRCKETGEYRLLFEAVSRKDKGAVLATAEFLLQESPKEPAPRAGGMLGVTEGDTRLVIRGKEVEMVFDRAEGSVKSLKIKGKEYLEGGLAPASSTQAQCSYLVQEGGVVLQAQYALPDGSRSSARFTLRPDGILKVESPAFAFRLSAGQGPWTCFGREPDSHAHAPFKTVREVEDGTDYYTDTSWLDTGLFTVTGTAPFRFCRQASRLEIVPEDAFTLLPGKKPKQATTYLY